MKYVNTTGYKLCLNKESVFAHKVTTHDYEPEDIKQDANMTAFLASGYLKPYTGKEIPPAAPKPAQDARYIRDDNSAPQKVVTDKITKQPLYIIADGDSLDNIATGSEDVVIAEDGSNPSPDNIESPLKVNENGGTTRDMIEDALNQDDADSTFDDTDNIADMEGELDDVEDVDDFMAKDAAMFIKKNGKAGAKVVTAGDMVKDDLSKAITEMNNTLASTSDDAESTSTNNTKVNDFLRQPYQAKKKMISKETDKTLLKEISDATVSKNLKDVVTQRLSELK